MKLHNYVKSALPDKLTFGFTILLGSYMHVLLATFKVLSDYCSCTSTLVSQILHDQLNWGSNRDPTVKHVPHSCATLGSISCIGSKFTPMSAHPCTSLVPRETGNGAHS